MLGPGTLVLSGANTYSGGTTLSGGTLRVAVATMGSPGAITSSGIGRGTLTFDGGTLQTGIANLGIANNIAVNATGGAIDSNGQTLSLSGTLGNGTGAGGLTITDSAGRGIVDLTGNGSAYTGTVTVSAGALGVGSSGAAGASLGGAVAVSSGASLFDLGTIGGNLVNAGSVIPGGTLGQTGALGALTVNGNYTQRSSGTLTIEVSPSTASQLKVGGAASLAGTLALFYDPGVYTPKTYTLLSAASVSGIFSTATGSVPTAGLNQTVNINPNNVQLALIAARIVSLLRAR